MKNAGTVLNNLKLFDNSFLKRNINIIAGVDEAGRGPIAGPVVAAAAIFEKQVFNPAINDSKKLSAKSREELYHWIVKNCVSYGIGIIDQKEIDLINILQAALKAMRIASESLIPTPDLILIDGNKVFKSSINTHCVVKGDSKSFSVAAASIIAKVTRDNIMREYSKTHPIYMWHKNKGYGTKEHIDAVKNYGVTNIHRISFLRKIVSAQEQTPVMI
ncbi:MAG: ribonuclease HII [Bacteroidota bacterium]